jgi:hypothetical protein
MRWLVIVGLMVGCGCAAPKAPPAVSAKPTYVDVSAASLAFSPPVALNEAPVFLSREARQPGAFVGFDELTATFSYVRTDDRQDADGTTWVMRRAISERVGVSYR